MATLAEIANLGHAEKQAARDFENSLLSDGGMRMAFLAGIVWARAHDRQQRARPHRCSLCRGTRIMGKALVERPPHSITCPLPTGDAWRPAGVRNPITEPVVACASGLTCERCKGTGQEPT